MTNDPQLVETSVSGTAYALTETEYRDQARILSSTAAFVAILKKPAGLSGQARFGVHLMIGDRDRSWIVDGDAASGYTLYADLNGNGDLTDDEARRFVVESGKPTLRFTSPLVFKLVLDQLTPNGQTSPRLALVRYATTRRKGQLNTPGRGRPLAFRITGRNGVYNEASMPISFDLDDDGTFDTEIERYVISERVININHQSFEFSVDRQGRQVSLTPLADSRPDRAILKTGYPAPDFQFVDLAGGRHRLADFRGRVVLLDFWGVWCAACVAGVPEMVDLYAKYHARGFDILGIEARDAPDVVRRFVSERQMPWIQILESDKGPIATLYRIGGWPSAYLIGADGTFVAANYLGEVNLRAELQKLFPDRP